MRENTKMQVCVLMGKYFQPTRFFKLPVKIPPVELFWPFKFKNKTFRFQSFDLSLHSNTHKNISFFSIFRMELPFTVQTTSVWKNYLLNYNLHPKDEISDCRAFLESCTSWLEDAVNSCAQHYNLPVKYWSALKVRLSKTGGEERSSYFTHTVQIMNIEEKPNFSHIFNQIIENLHKYQEKGSGWNVDCVEHLQVHLSPWKPIRGGTYVPLPDFIKKKKAILNIKSKDQKCFIWSVIASRIAIPWGKNPSQVKNYKPFELELDTTGLAFPMTLDQVKTFEERNNMSVNVYSCDEENKQVTPLRVSQTTRQEHIHLFYYKGHFSLVRSLDRLLSSSYNTMEANIFVIAASSLSGQKKS